MCILFKYINLVILIVLIWTVKAKAILDGYIKATNPMTFSDIPE